MQIVRSARQLVDIKIFKTIFKHRELCVGTSFGGLYLIPIDLQREMAVHEDEKTIYIHVYEID